jgi:hypothetical protein
MDRTAATVGDSASPYVHLARLVLVAFLLTFMFMRIAVFLIMSRAIPDLYVHVGGTHVHHLNFGIFLLSVVGGYLLFAHPSGRRLQVTAILYGVGMGLTFDEFGMWIHLGGSYWQRASWDAITVIAAGLSLLAFAPSLKRLRPHHLVTAAILGLVLIAFTSLLVRSFHYAERRLGPRLERIESTSPQ